MKISILLAPQRCYLLITVLVLLSLLKVLTIIIATASWTYPQMQLHLTQQNLGFLSLHSPQQSGKIFLYACIFMCVYIHMEAYNCIGYLPWSLSTLFIDVKSFLELGFNQANLILFGRIPVYLPFECCDYRQPPQQCGLCSGFKNHISCAYVFSRWSRVLSQTGEFSKPIYGI